jgi:hypothetical protein
MALEYTGKSFRHDPVKLGPRESAAQCMKNRQAMHYVTKSARLYDENLTQA